MQILIISQIPAPECRAIEEFTQQICSLAHTQPTRLRPHYTYEKPIEHIPLRAVIRIVARLTQGVGGLPITVGPVIEFKPRYLALAVRNSPGLTQLKQAIIANLKLEEGYEVGSYDHQNVDHVTAAKLSPAQFPLIAQQVLKRGLAQRFTDCPLVCQLHSVEVRYRETRNDCWWLAGRFGLD